VGGGGRFNQLSGLSGLSASIVWDSALTALETCAFKVHDETGAADVTLSHTHTLVSCRPVESHSGAQGKHSSGAHDFQGEREPITGVWGQCPQWAFMGGRAFGRGSAGKVP